MPYTYTLTTTIPASARAIYEAWLDSIAHSEMTGSAAEMSDEIGGEVSAWDGYISGRNLELISGERIVQSWRTTKFDDDQDDSVITVLLEEAEDGTLLTLIHSNVPDDHRSYEEGGWQSNYFEPMQAYFATLEPDEEEPEATPMPKPAQPATAASTPKAGRTAGGTPKRTVPKAKAAPAKKESKRASAAKSKRKTAAAKKRVKAVKKKAAKLPASKKSTKKSGTKKSGTKKSGTKKSGTKKSGTKKSGTKRKVAPRKHR
jgi:uncharacterized protein YndB with AHSA1/START domain